MFTLNVAVVDVNAVDVVVIVAVLLLSIAFNKSQKIKFISIVYKRRLFLASLFEFEAGFKRATKKAKAILIQLSFPLL